MDCIFCKIINGELSSYKIYEDEYAYAFLDINPDSNGHTLVIPKKHTKDLDSISDIELSNLYKSIKIIKKDLEDKLNCDGLTLIQNNGDVQEVKHFHIHLKPYYNKKQKLKSAEEMYKILKNCD